MQQNHILHRALQFAQFLIGRVVQTGDVVIDATVGNGHDTLFLSNQVGANGLVYGFDIQQEALAEARRRLEAAHVETPVQFYRVGHEKMAGAIPLDRVGHVRAVMFNLGYLPGGNRSIITRPITTIAALQAAISLLAPGGLITVVLYTGHDGGAEEADAVLAWARHLDQERFQVLSYQFVNQRNQPPMLVAIERYGF
jgi:predicted methyltransferase